MSTHSHRPGERRLRDQIRFLLDVARALTHEPDLDALFQRLYTLIADQFPVWTFFIALAEDAGALDVPFYVSNGKRFHEPIRLSLEDSISGGVFRSGEPALVRTAEEFDALPA